MLMLVPRWDCGCQLFSGLSEWLRLVVKSCLNNDNPVGACRHNAMSAAAKTMWYRCESLVGCHGALATNWLMVF